MKKQIINRFLFSFILIINISLAQEEIKELKDFSLEDLLKIDIVSVTKLPEKLQTTPASVLILTQEDIINRGYSDLIEMFNDLPGIDLSITYGDLYHRSYMRGYRKSYGSPYLLMVDDRVMNNLWYNWTDVLLTIPIINIKKIEIIYGPSSSVYGPNALMGLINIITEKNPIKSGSTYKIRTSVGNFENKMLDFTYNYKGQDFILNFSGYFNKGEIDKNSIENYEYTKSKYITDRKLWGKFVDMENIAAGITSPRNIRAFQFNAKLSAFEIGANYYRFGDMYGFTYPLDRIHSTPIWREDDIDIYLKTDIELTESVKNNFILRYRESNIPNSSQSLEMASKIGEKRKVTFGYWQSLNSSWSLNSDFEIGINDKISLITGIKYEYKDLQKDYEINYSAPIAPEEITDSFTFPSPPTETGKSENRTKWEDYGAFIQTKFNLNKLLSVGDDNYLNLGIRYDRNSVYGENVNLRAGLINVWGNVTTKLLYGESVQEPSPREVYANWSASGNEVQLITEKSTTFELFTNYTIENFSFTFNPFYSRVKDAITNVNDRPSNIGERNIWGIDLLLNLNFNLFKFNDLKFWTYYSYINTKEKKYDNLGNYIRTGEIGDIAPHKIYLGTTFKIKDFITTLRARFISEKNTVDSNPVGKIPSYITADINLRYRNFFIEGLDLGLKITNLFNEKYYHSGIMQADSGIEPGYWIEDRWFGSKGWYNSMLPQPGRGILFSVYIYK